MGRPDRLIPLLRTLLCGLLLACVLWIGAPAWAAKAAPTRPQAPATEATMDLYMRLSAINFCLARSIGQLDIDKAVPIAGETVVVLLQNEHGSRIKQVGQQPLSVEELRRGAYDSVLLGAMTFCPKDIPDELRQSLEAAIQAQTASSAEAGTPRAVDGTTPAPPESLVTAAAPSGA